MVFLAPSAWVTAEPREAETQHAIPTTATIESVRMCLIPLRRCGEAFCSRRRPRSAGRSERNGRERAAQAGVLHQPPGGVHVATGAVGHPALRVEAEAANGLHRACAHGAARQ